MSSARGVLPNAFAATTVGATSTAATFSMTNGNAADTISTWGLRPGSLGDFSFGTVSGCTLGTLFPLNTVCTSNVAFTPTAPGLRTAQLLVTDMSGQKSYQSLTGVGNSAAVAFAPGLISTLATVTGPNAVALDSLGNAYIASSDNTVRMVNAQTNAVTTVAGTGTAGYTGDGAAATAATLKAPGAVALDPTGNLYVADTGNNVVRLIGIEGNVIRSVTPVGLLNAPKGLATDVQGNVYIADTGNNVIREVVAKTTQIATIAGTGTAGSTGDTGAATAAKLKAPAAVAVDASGNIYIADTGNNTVRKIAASTGIITTIAGTAGTPGNTGDGGAATSATLNIPSQIAVDAAGDVVIACAGSNSVRFVSASTGTISTLVGTGTAGYTGDAGFANAATLTAAAGVALDQFANVYVGDTGNNALRKVVSTTTSLTFAHHRPRQVDRRAERYRNELRQPDAHVDWSDFADRLRAEDQRWHRLQRHLRHRAGWLLHPCGGVLAHRQWPLQRQHHTD